MIWNPFDHHRGPYQFQVMRPKRPTKVRPASCTCELLTPLVDTEDVEEEAHALLEDPRDTIEAVYVWSVKEQQHIVTYRREEENEIWE